MSYQEIMTYGFFGFAALGGIYTLLSIRKLRQENKKDKETAVAQQRSAFKEEVSNAKNEVLKELGHNFKIVDEKFVSMCSLVTSGKEVVDGKIKSIEEKRKEMREDIQKIQDIMSEIKTGSEHNKWEIDNIKPEIEGIREKVEELESIADMSVKRD